MKARTLYLIFKTIFSLFMLVSAFGELSLNEAVVDSMLVIDMPIYLLGFLGVAKLLGILVLWLPGLYRLKEWAYAGFFFDFVGAIYAFTMSEIVPMPDIYMAPLALVLLLVTYAFYRKQHPLAAVKGL